MPEGTERPIHLSLRWRIVLLLLLASLLPLALTGAGAWVVFGRLTLDKTLAQQRDMVAFQARSIDLYLQERLRALEVVARSHTLEALTSPGALHQVFEDFNAVYPRDFIDLGLIDSRGDHLAYEGPYDLRGRNYKAAAWFSTVRDHGSFISDIFLGFRKVPHCVIAVRRRQGQDMWILRATINSEQFNALVAAIRPGQSGDAFLQNREGITQTPPREGRVLESSAIGLVEPHAGIKEARVELDDGTVRRLTTWLSQKNWVLVVQQDEREILAEVNQALLLGGLLVSLAVVLVIVATYLATTHLTSRIDLAHRQRDDLSRDLMRSARLASLGELSTGLAHEINNPLAIISAEQTNISDLILESSLPEEIRRDLLASVERCKRQVVRCSNITAKMLQFGRKKETAIKPTDIASMVQEVIALLERQAKVSNIELRPNMETGLPQVAVDPTELQQVLVNLINNAMHAIEGNGRITVELHRVEHELRLEVVDTGAGIPPENLDRIFQPFFTTKPVGQGTGLGLSVCYGLVQGWGGRIEAKSKLGEGTRMIVRLPLPPEEKQA